MIDSEPNYYRSGHAGSSGRALADIFRMSDVRFLSVLTDIWIRKSIATLLQPTTKAQFDLFTSFWFKKTFPSFCQFFSIKVWESNESEPLNSDEDIILKSDWYQTNDQVGLTQAGQVTVDISISLTTIHPRCHLNEVASAIFISFSL